MGKKKKIVPDTDTFHFSNLNPKGRSTGDCVVRAFAAFLNLSWEQVYTELAQFGLEHATAMNCPETYVKFLLSKGWEKEPMPRRSDRTKYTGREFCKELAKPGYVYILAMAGHLTFVGADSRIWDTWDCGEKSVGNVWSRSL